tara:strand:- start:2021 stop:3001 length:981 start_codon:yes stop_codon:yes gene_type:complete
MKFYKNKKVLITGGAGFIGSHLVKKLQSIGAKVHVVVKYNSFIDCPRISKIWNKINIIEADLRNTDSVLSFKNKKFDIVFHLAAYNHVGDSFKHVTENISSNLLSTVNLLNNGPKFKKFVHIGSSEIYGLQTKIPFNVEETPNPLSPYALSKFSSELFSIQQAKEKKLNIVCIRPFNTFGPYQSEKAIIPELIIKSLLNKEIKTTLGNQTREFNFIENIIDGILLIGKKSNFNNTPINLGSNKPVKIKNLIKIIHYLTNSQSSLKIGALKYRPNEIWKMQANNKFAKNVLGWKPRVDFKDGLKITINWYKNFLRMYNKDSLFIKIQ